MNRRTAGRALKAVPPLVVLAATAALAAPADAAGAPGSSGSDSSDTGSAVPVHEIVVVPGPAVPGGGGIRAAIAGPPPSTDPGPTDFIS